MNESLDDVVRDVVARHLDVDIGEIDPDVNLVHDLHLDPLDLVLIALRLEEMEQTEFPIHRLEFVETLGELANVVHEMRASAFDDRAFTLDETRVSEVVPAHGRTRRARHGNRATAPVRRRVSA